jgi:hypothetical protein
MSPAKEKGRLILNQIPDDLNPEEIHDFSPLLLTEKHDSVEDVSSYFPYFIFKKSDYEYFDVETKGLKDLDVPFTQLNEMHDFKGVGVQVDQQ